MNLLRVVHINKKTGKRIAAIIPVHVFGTPVNMDPLLELAEQFNIAVIEDATESLGSTIREKRPERLESSDVSALMATKLLPPALVV